MKSIDRRTALRRAAFLAGTAVVGCRATTAKPSGPLVVSAAADLQEACDRLAPLFRDAGGQDVLFNFGASGLLAQQIASGAKVDVFASANVAFVDKLIDQKLIDAATRRLYARGRLVLWARADGVTLTSMQSLMDHSVRRIAVANPATAPYGAAANEALEESGVLHDVRPKLVFGEDVRQTFQFAATGAADAAIVSASLVRGPN
ncbi:MAG: molybdate ABC transporter substrate-binding protein, partial [Planctomycetia bacterium]